MKLHQVRFFLDKQTNVQTQQKRIEHDSNALQKVF